MTFTGDAACLLLVRRGVSRVRDGGVSFGAGAGVSSALGTRRWIVTGGVDAVAAALEEGPVGVAGGADALALDFLPLPPLALGSAFANVPSAACARHES